MPATFPVPPCFRIPIYQRGKFYITYTHTNLIQRSAISHCISPSPARLQLELWSIDVPSKSSAPRTWDCARNTLLLRPVPSRALLWDVLQAGTGHHSTPRQPLGPCSFTSSCLLAPRASSLICHWKKNKISIQCENNPLLQVRDWLHSSWKSPWCLREHQIRSTFPCSLFVSVQESDKKGLSL